jgi:diguanylate cyclase (GGDEF)-like protein
VLRGFPRRLQANTLEGMPNPALKIELIDAFGAGVYLLTALTHADLWWHRRDRPAHAWLSLSACGALIVNITGAIYRVHPAAESSRWLALNMFGVALALVSLYELAQSLGGRRSTRFARGVEALTFLPALLTVFLATPMLNPVLYGLSTVFLFAAMVQSLRFGHSGDAESRTLATGLLVLFTMLIYDMLSELGLIPRIEGTPVLGFTVLYMAAARALSLRYDREYRELLDLRGELQARVQARTAELEAANLELDRLARTDPLTGLANRRSFLATAMQHELVDKALLMIDVDHFKRINDTHGHDSGDQALRAIARTLATTLLPGEIAARWGGEEFIVLMTGTDARRRAEALRQHLAQIELDGPVGVIRLSASIGVSLPGATGTLDQRLVAADRALYQAKQSGRNRVEIADG